MRSFKEYVEQQEEYLDYTDMLDEKVEWEWRVSANGKKEKYYYSSDPRKKIIDDHGVKREVTYSAQERANRKRAQNSSGKMKRKSIEGQITARRKLALSKKDGYRTDGHGQVNRARELSNKPLLSDIRGAKKAKKLRALKKENPDTDFDSMIKSMEQDLKNKLNSLKM